MTTFNTDALKKKVLFLWAIIPTQLLETRFCLRKYLKSILLAYPSLKCLKMTWKLNNYLKSPQGYLWVKSYFCLIRLSNCRIYMWNRMQKQLKMINQHVTLHMFLDKAFCSNSQMIQSTFKSGKHSLVPFSNKNFSEWFKLLKRSHSKRLKIFKKKIWPKSTLHNSLFNFKALSL